jgi:DNA anti-recombination protein RmuC
MGLFQGKQKTDQKAPIDEKDDGVQKFFDGYFHELRVRGRVYFEESVDESVAEFKKELDATITDANAELKKHIVEKLEEQFAENHEIIKEAQRAALVSLTTSAKTVADQQRELGEKVQKNIADQEAVQSDMLEQSKARVAEINRTQDEALQSLTGSVKAVEDLHREINDRLQKSVADQEAMILNAFEENMARIVEHYLLQALGDQYDMKAQLPAIIQQLEANKQAIVDDMKL